MAAIQRLDIFEDLYFKDSSNYDVDFLAKLLNKQKKDIISALHVSSATAKRSGIDPDNEIMKDWMRIFNLVVDLIQDSEPGLSKAEIQTKMGRFLRLPNSHFSNKSLLEVMIEGKARKAVRLLEQLAN